jgi:hypothetical protein
MSPASRLDGDDGRDGQDTTLKLLVRDLVDADINRSGEIFRHGTRAE